MSRKFQLEKDYYDEGYDLYKKKTITIKPKITVLVGCNGIGKTTLLHQLKSHLKKKNIPCISFNNLDDGGRNAMSEASFYGDLSFLSTSMQSSEGENIVMNMESFARRLGDFVKTGEDPKESKYKNLAIAMKKASGETIEETEIPKERWILLDAIDSGLSIDNIVDIKEDLFKTILEYNCGNEIYIIVVANEYEMARNEQCFDVYNGKYITFKDYEDYRQFVLDSKELKEKRYKE
jgi:energy-coupling factor transporter ATP-binding protein EcfA2